MNKPMPTVFISHGAPTLAIEDTAAHRFLRKYGECLGRPRAIVVLSAHYAADRPTVTSGLKPGTIYDFQGFPQTLYRITYPAAGDAGLADRIADLLAALGEGVTLDPIRGFDHGAWIPLVLMYPDASVPLVQVSIDPHRGAAYHLRLGELLAPLRDDGVLIIGSGGATHNLRAALRERHEQTPSWVIEFNEWLADTVAAGRIDDLLDYRDKAPHATENHPTEEHYFPLLCALGAAGGDGGGRRAHQSYEYGVLSMDAYEFGGVADA